jgi:hypothetical protein
MDKFLDLQRHHSPDHFCCVYGMEKGKRMKTTLNKIRGHAPCVDGWKKLLKHLGKTQPDDEPLSLLTILDSNGIDDTIWCFRAVEGYDKEKRLFAVWCARQVQHLMADQRSIDALDVAERYANGLETDDELSAAWAAAWAAAGAAARTAWAAARAAARTAWAAAGAAARTAEAAARTAEAAAWAAARTAEAAAGAAAGAAARASQAAKLREVLREIEE